MTWKHHAAGAALAHPNSDMVALSLNGYQMINTLSLNNVADLMQSWHNAFYLSLQERE